VLQVNVVKNSGIAWTDVGIGVQRRALAHNKDGMVVEVQFETGGIGPMHSHPHVQCTYVQSGTFVFSAGGQDDEVTAGDTLAFAKNETHGCVCKAAGTLIDVFSPMREDFL
jgi:quercetin dioxygenase-like cupin family protein